MLGAIARGSAGDYLAALADETAQRAHVFVIDLERLVGAKAAYLTPSTGAPPTHPAAAAALAAFSPSPSRGRRQARARGLPPKSVRDPPPPRSGAGRRLFQIFPRQPFRFPG